MMEAKIKGTVLSGNQKSQKLIIQMNVPFLALKRRHRFTQIDEPEVDIDDLSADRSNLYYQRSIDKRRTKEIADFIRRSIINEYKGNSVAVIFPTAMLLATSIEDTDYNIGGEYDIPLDQDGQEINVIDGQHRLSGMLHLYNTLSESLFNDDESEYIKKYLEEYKFNCTLLLNFDLWEQAQVFADVNFNQKKVSKNLYYTIYGMHYPETDDDLKKNYIYVAHRLVLLLNKFDKSPLYNSIKMIGTDKGLISQSFFADSLIRNIRYPSGIWNYVLTQPKPRLRPIATECMTFFQAVKEVFEENWIEEGGHKSILTKTTGIGAMIRTMEYLHRFRMDPSILSSIHNTKDGYFCKEYYDVIVDKLNEVKKKNPDIFSFNGEFAGSGGLGLERKLFEKIKLSL